MEDQKCELKLADRENEGKFGDREFERQRREYEESRRIAFMERMKGHQRPQDRGSDCGELSSNSPETKRRRLIFLSSGIRESESDSNDGNKMGLQPLTSVKSERVPPSAQAELLTAIKYNSVDDVKRLLPEADPEWMYGYPDYGSCLYIAAKMGFTDVAKVLIDHKADVNGYNATRKNTPLHAASELGHSDMVKLLIDKGGKIDTKDAYGRIPLHLAAKGPPTGKPYGKGHLRSIKELVDAGSPKNAKDRQRNTPLLLAINAGHKDAVKLLIESGAYSDADSTSRSLIREKMPDIYEELSPPERDNSREEYDVEVLLFDFMYERDVDKFKALIPTAIKKGLDVSQINDGKYTLLQYACENEGLGEFITALLDSGVSPNATSCGNADQPLLLAAYQGNSNALSILVDHTSADLTFTDESAETPLHKAAKMEKIEYEGRNYKKCIEILTKAIDKLDDKIPKVKRLDVNAVDAKGNTALHYAAYNLDDGGRQVEEIVEGLIRAGAHLGIINKKGELAISRFPAHILNNLLYLFREKLERRLRL